MLHGVCLCSLFPKAWNPYGAEGSRGRLPEDFVVKHEPYFWETRTSMDDSSRYNGENDFFEENSSDPIGFVPIIASAPLTVKNCCYLWA